MGLFSSKETKKRDTCLNCNKEIGFGKYKISDGYICYDCYKLCGYSFKTPIAAKTLSNIKNDIIKQEDYKKQLSEFTVTKRVGTLIEFDEEKRLWIIPDGFRGSKKKPRIYSFDDIVEYELLEDGNTITKGGLGRAVVGGVLFGGVGAIVGGVTGGKKSNSVVNSLKIKITINDFQTPAIFINLITTKTKSSSSVYKMAYEQAQQILSVFAIIQKQNESVQNDINNTESNNLTFSAADEILKFKSLLDQGIITKEEFDEKKKQLLNYK